MSTTYNNEYSRLFGIGSLHVKRRLPEQLFWQIDGKGLYDLDEPISTVHLVYEVAQIDNLQQKLQSMGQLSKKGEVFTIFERRVADQIVITINRAIDFPQSAILLSLLFSEF